METGFVEPYCTRLSSKDREVRPCSGFGDEVSTETASELVMLPEPTIAAISDNCHTAVHDDPSILRDLVAPIPGQLPDGMGWGRWYLPARNAESGGGDCCDCFALALSGKVVAVIADVEGKDGYAARWAAIVRIALHAFLRENPCPSMALARLNRLLIADQGDTQPAPLVAATAFVVDSLTGEGIAATAGSEHPMIVRHRGITTTREEIECVPSCGVLLGILDGASYESVPFTLGRGEALALATDGITEARSKHGLFGVEGMATALTAAKVAGLDAQRSADLIGERAQHFAGGHLRDDACVVIVSR